MAIKEIALFLLFFLPSAVFAENISISRCSDPEWTEGYPFMKDSHFRSSLAMHCRVELPKAVSTSELANRLNRYLESHREVHGEPTYLKIQNLEQWVLDTSVIVGDEGKTLKVRETVKIQLNSKNNHLSYQTQSESIQASGLASYLKEVSFSADIRKDQDKILEIDYQNAISVKRPWYALEPVFYLISKGVAKDKFQESEHRLTQLILEELISDEESIKTEKKREKQ